MGVDRLPPDRLRRRADLSAIPFTTTADLPEIAVGVGQDRALEAVRFGIAIRHPGYNLYALGPAGVGKHTLVRRYLEEQAAHAPVPSDWCYVHNFEEPHRPRALRLPAGKGTALRRDLQELVDELKVMIPAAFESDDYRSRRRLVDARFQDKNEEQFSAIEKEAREKGILLLRTPVGLALAPEKDGEAMDPDAFRHLPEPDQARFREAMAVLQERLQAAIAALPEGQRKHREAVRALDREVTAFAVGHLVGELRTRWAGEADVCKHLDAIEQDVVENADAFQGREAPDAMAALLGKRNQHHLRRYEVNVLVDRDGVKGAPVVYEDHPSLPNLVGRVEYLSEMGNLVTDFRLIKGGDLHRANGGALIVDALKVLQQPSAWEELKRALRSRQVRVESVAQALGLQSTATLEPEPIPLDVKIVLVGERMIYHLLARLDPDFLELFKVAADFEDAVPRDGEGEGALARLLAGLAREKDLRPLDREAVAAAIDHAARLADDSGRLSVHVSGLADLLREADFLTGEAGRAVITAADVGNAVRAQERRAGRYRDRLLEEFEKGTFLIDTDGAVVGQVNGLSVIDLGSFTFGRPSRISARVRLGAGRVIDIEREVRLGGALHSKGVLILSGFLGSRYAPDKPLSLQASLVFEQSYGGVDGDSASCAELVALLSALSDVPLRQSVAITGSIDQLGRVQAIGGVNEKIEGFFDLCRVRGLTGDQGVAIPHTNVRHLMLREDVVQAVAEGRFHVWPVATADEAVEVLTGGVAGERGADGKYPEGTVNQKVEARLLALAEKAKESKASGGNNMGTPP